MKSLITLIAASFVLLTPLKTHAVTSPPLYYINDATEECSNDFFTGDECSDCTVSADFLSDPNWEQNSGFCPDGYEYIDVPVTCDAIKGPFCCSTGHSGTSGECSSLIINDSSSECSFAENPDACPTTSDGWYLPEENSLCPLNYEFVDDVTCNSEVENGADVTPPDQGENPNVVKPGMPEERTIFGDFQISDLMSNYILYPFGILVLIGIILFLFAFIGFVRNKRRDW